jgi:nucleoside phosphorylase
VIKHTQSTHVEMGFTMQADFAIITMREDEYKALASRFNPTPQRGASRRNYAISQIQTKDGKNRTVAIARCEEQGPQPAQQLANDMIKDLSPSLLLVVGIAGGDPDTDFTLGDVVVSSRIHDFGVNALKPGKIEWNVRGGIHPYVSEIIASLPMYETDLEGWNAADSLRIPRPALDIKKFRDFDLTKLTPQDKQSMFDGKPPQSWQQKILDSLKWHFDDPPQRSAKPLYTSGSIGSSGSLVRDTAILIQWLQDAHSIRAVEMEAGGVFQAAQQLRQQYPVMAIRGISDVVGLKRDYRWTPYACHSAAAFTYALLTANSKLFENLPLTDVKPDPPLPDNGVKSVPNGVPPNGKEEPAPIQVYISYAEKDEELIKELEMHLSVLKRQQIISLWYSRQIGLGREKDKEFDSHIDTAQIILLLVSRSFMASIYTYEQEMSRAMQRHANGQACVVPILLRPTDVKNAPFSNIQGLPRNNKPVVSWSDRDQAWLEIVQGIRGLCEELKGLPISGQSSTRSDFQNKLFDVFLCHNNKDKAEVKEIAKQLEVQGIKPWLDEWELQPGLPWQRTLEQQIGEIKSAAVFVGASGFGPWQNMELDAFLREFVNRDCPIIPVLLKTAPDKPKLPPFLAGMTWVDFHKQEPEPMKQLIWGITSKKPDAHANQAAYSPSSVVQTSSTSTSLTFPKKAELVDKLLACSCMRNRDSRETVLSLLNEQFPGLANGVSRRTDNQADVMEIVSTCLKHPGSLQELVSIVTYFEGESSLHTQQLRAFIQSNSF